MTRRRAPRLALALLRQFVPDSGPLAGDLVEEFEARQSRVWFWWQVAAAVVIARCERPVDIRPLQLVDLQPADALERSRRWTGRCRPANLSASPLPDVGGLGLLVLTFHLTVVMPEAWWLLLASILAGVVGGGVRVALHEASPDSSGLSIRGR